ncbi:hypothetical protein PInf_018824 [Phytophthora infestans]|nr:hypothetical protein PInf_018824 [Phytophthora infestans]
MPRVTFVGSREAWSSQRKRYSSLYTIPPDDVYKWLAVLNGINNVFQDEDIQAVDTPKRRELLRAMASSVEACVHISESAVVSAIDEETEGDSGVRDESLSGVDDTVIVRSSAVLPNIEQSDPAVVHGGSRPLPSGPLPQRYVGHFLHYGDGRFEKSGAFISMRFNQLQRHAADQKAARVGVVHGSAMKKFGELIGTQKFKEALAFAKNHP